MHVTVTHNYRLYVSWLGCLPFCTSTHLNHTLCCKTMFVQWDRLSIAACHKVSKDMHWCAVQHGVTEPTCVIATGSTELCMGWCITAIFILKDVPNAVMQQICFALHQNAHWCITGCCGTLCWEKKDQVWFLVHSKTGKENMYPNMH